MKKYFYTSKEVMEMLDCGTLKTAQLRIQAMNEELKAKRFLGGERKGSSSLFS